MLNKPNCHAKIFHLPIHPLFNIGYPFRKTGLHGDVTTNYARKPVSYSLEILVNKLHDFTSVQQAYNGVLNDPYTRIYKFERQRGTTCYIAWSETGWDTSTPDIPNGATVTFPVLSEQLELTHIITEFDIAQPVVETLQSTGGSLSLQLGYKPVIIEEMMPTGAEEGITKTEIEVFPNPANNKVAIKNLPFSGNIKIYDFQGKLRMEKRLSQNENILQIEELETGIYIMEIITGNMTWQKKTCDKLIQQRLKFYCSLMSFGLIFGRIVSSNYLHSSFSPHSLPHSYKILV